MMESPYAIEIDAELPPRGDIPPEDRHGPTSRRDHGNIIGIRNHDGRWLMRLEPGLLSGIEHYILEGRAFVVNVKGMLYWLDPVERRVITVGSRWGAFQSAEVPGGVIGYDYQDVVLLSSTGVAWVRTGLVGDGMILKSFDGNGATFVGWRTEPDNLLEFTLALADGTLIEEHAIPK